MINKILCFLTVLNFLYVPALLAEDVSPDKLFYWSDPRCVDNLEECQKWYQDSIKMDLIETDSPRVKWLNPWKIIDILDIKKGMTILDIGAGKGYFSVPFAKKMEGIGKIYATDIDPINVKDIQKRAETLGLANIEPVVVQKDGVDPFYQVHSYDLIFVSYVYYHLRHPENYFRTLRSSLKKGGRVCIIQPFDNPDLTLYIDTDSNEFFKKLLEVFSKEGVEFPIFKRFSSDVQSYILRWELEKKEISVQKRKEILVQLNDMLHDKTLFFALIDYWIPKQSFSQLEIIYKKYPSDASLIVWLANQLNNDRAFDSDKPLSELDKKRLSKLNNILIRGSLDIEFPLMGAFVGPQNYLIAQEDGIISAMEDAGYQLLERHTIKPAFILIFGVAD